MEALKTYVNERPLVVQMNDRLKDMCCTKAEAAIRMNYSRSALSQYLNGKYGSDPTELEKKIVEFLNDTEIHSKSSCRSQVNKSINEVTRFQIKPKIQFFESRDFVNVIGVCQACQEQTALGIVVGKSGYGKTHALQKYAALPRVVYVECNETMNCKDVVRKIEKAIGLPRAYGSIDERLEHIIEFFNISEGHLLIMDEADKLITKYTQKKIEILRYIADSANVGVVIAGEPMLESLVKAYDNRFANRMDFYYKLTGLTKNDVKEYLEGYTIDENALTEFVIRATNSQNGCFRLLDRTLNNAIRILRNSDGEKVTMKVLCEASNMMML